MNVFITGGTGVLGRAVIPKLLAEGHHVRALAHTDAAHARLRALGAEPVRGSLFDPDSLRAAVDGSDAILHLASRIPEPARMGRRSAWLTNDRIRRDGTRVLVDVALAAGVKLLVYAGIALVYPDRGREWIDAASTPPRGTGDVTGSSLDAEAQVARFTAAGGRGIVLRLGPLYGPDTPSTYTQLKLLRRGVASVFGPDDAYSPSLWTEDAGSALVAALRPAVPAGVYDVVDDEPLTRGELAQAMAEAAGQRWTVRLPMALVRLTMPARAPYVGLSTRISNRRFKAVSGWHPQVRDAREGWRRVAWSVETASTGRGPLVRAARPWLAVLLLVALPLGLWAVALPRSFYDAFPVLGHSWVSGDGPYNEHLLRDFGSLNLALAVAVLCALVSPTRELVRAVALATLVASVPHLAYHAVHLDLLPSGADAVVQTIALAVPILAGLALLRSPSPEQPTMSPPIGEVQQTPASHPNGSLACRDYEVASAMKETTA